MAPAVAALMLLAGCGGSSSHSNAQVPTVSLSRAADVSSLATGYKTSMVMHETVGSLGNIAMTAQGSFTPATHMGALTLHMTLPANAGLSSLQLQMVLVRTMLYAKLPPTLASRIPGGKPWVSVNLAQAAKLAGLPGVGSLFSSSSSMTNPGQYLSYLRATAAGSVKNLGQATVNGISTTHYHAEVDLSKLPSVVPAAERQSIEQLVAALKRRGAATQLPLDVWIDSSHLVRRIQLNFTQPENGQNVSVAMTENFLQYGRQPVPTVPSASQTENLLSLVHGTTT